MDKRRFYKKHSAYFLHLPWGRLAFLAVGIVFAASLWAAPRPSPWDYAGQVDVLKKLMEREGGRYRLHAIDLFEEKTAFVGRANSNMLSLAEYIRRSPKRPAFKKEIKIINKHTETRATARFCLGLQTAFEIPGEESWKILYKNPIPIRGQLVRLSLWVKSKNYRHRLFLLFSNANGKKVKVNAGKLDWQGWRRLSLDLPKSLYHRGRRLERPYTHFFRGFLIRSDKKEKAGSLYIELDNLLILSDQRELRYPGSEIKDDWKRP